MRDAAPKQVAIETKFLEVNFEYRTFMNWNDVSGNDPTVISNQTRNWAAGINIGGGYQLGTLPIWAQAAGYYGTGLQTNTMLADGETIHGKVNSYGLGAGARLVPYNVATFALYLWAMGYYDWDDGNFDIDNGETRSENRIHRSLMGDYGVGAVYVIDQIMGINFGISYSGLFDKKNADENIRLKLGLILNPPREIIY